MASSTASLCAHPEQLSNINSAASFAAMAESSQTSIRTTDDDLGRKSDRLGNGYGEGGNRSHSREDIIRQIGKTFFCLHPHLHFEIDSVSFFCNSAHSAPAIWDAFAYNNQSMGGQSQQTELIIAQLLHSNILPGRRVLYFTHSPLPHWNEKM